MALLQALSELDARTGGEFISGLTETEVKVFMAKGKSATEFTEITEKNIENL